MNITQLTADYYAGYIRENGNLVPDENLSPIIRQSVLEKIQWCQDDLFLKPVIEAIFTHDHPSPRQFVVCVNQDLVELFMYFGKEMVKVADPNNTQAPKHLLVSVFGGLSRVMRRLNSTFYAAMENRLTRVDWDDHFQWWFGHTVIQNYYNAGIKYTQLWDIMKNFRMVWAEVCYHQ